MDPFFLFDLKTENQLGCFYSSENFSSSQPEVSWFPNETLFSSNDFCDVPFVDPLNVSWVNDDIAPFQTQLPPLLEPSNIVSDVNIDITSWDDSFPSYYENNAVTDALPLNVYAGSQRAFESMETTHAGTAICSGKSDERSSLDGRWKSSCIDFDEISKYFYVPITQAAKEMKVGLTVLKKRCRELGITRWPHRKMKSLKSLIHNVQELSSCNRIGEAGEIRLRREEMEKLEEHRRLMEKRPEMQLTEETKKLRQACFKANYKKRRLMAMSVYQ